MVEESYHNPRFRVSNDLKRPLYFTKPILKPQASPCENSFTCLKEQTLGLEGGYKNSVEVHGVWCTKDCYYPRSYTIWQKSRFVYSLFCSEYWYLQTFNGLYRWGKCVTWIATELNWRHLTHAFLTHNCMFGLARVQVRLALHIFNTNNSTLLMFGDSFTLCLIFVKVIILLWTSMLVCTQTMESRWDSENTHKWGM